MYCKFCRICKSEELKDVIFLGDQMITSRFPVYGDFSTPKTDITLCLCKECGLLQLRECVMQEELYEYEYGYMSGISNTMKTHLKNYKDEITNKISLNPGDIILDIGSNDGTMLKYYDDSYIKIGVDPTGKQFKKYYDNVRNLNLLPTYFTYDNVVKEFGQIKCKIISSICMFYDLPDPVQFAKDIHSLLDDDGIWTCEQSYLITMLEHNSIDTICHEHLEYYSLHQIIKIAELSNLKVLDVSFNTSNGGSFRVYLAKKSSLLNVNENVINEILENERIYKLNDHETYINFITKCDLEISKLKEFIELIKKDNKTMYIYGASTKGNCLLQYANITSTDIKYAVERNLNKVGKMTCTGIEIISEEDMRKNPPDYLLVLPWHFKEEIIKRETEFLDQGGQFVFPFPNFEIKSNKKKVLITGCDGMIAKYVKEEFKNENLYGFTRINHSESANSEKMTKFYFDMNDDLYLYKVLDIIQPDYIIHLASFSNANYCKNNCVETIKTNGLLTVQLCEYIVKNKLDTRMFNAASSEMYKGHLTYNVKENDHNKYHNQPYSIAKIMGSSIVDFYRTHYGKHFSNGIIFTTESKYKSDTFLLKKVANHLKNLKNLKNLNNSDSDSRQHLTVGNLDSFRNIIHGSDVASAIKLILEQKEGNNYNICGDNKYKMIDLVKELYSYNNTCYTYEKIDKNEYFYVNDKLDLLINNEEFEVTDVNGFYENLSYLNWKPKYKKQDILKELLLD